MTRPADLDPLVPNGATCCGNLDLLFPTKILRCQGGGGLGDVLWCADRCNVTAFDSWSRSEINDHISRPHCIFVMFDNNYSVALIPEMLECREEMLVIARMQANTRFVENIDHPSQACPDLTG